MIFDKNRVLIRTENMSKSCMHGNETIEAVKDANIRVLQGEFIIIEGLSGTKKSIFFNLIGCLERPISGKYYFDYEDIALAKTDMLDSIRKNKIGYLFRNFNLINRLTVWQNIEIPMHWLNISREEKKHRLQKALLNFEIEHIAKEKVSRLSDWEKQLVSLARAVVNNPLMIIADEPAANLDSREEGKLIEHLFRLNKEGITVILMTERAALKALKGCRLISFNEARVVRSEV